MRDSLIQQYADVLYLFLLPLNILSCLFPGILDRDPALRFNPTSITTDFEHAAISAFSAAFPEATIHGCLFHLSQCVLRKVNEVGLKVAYQTDPNFAIRIRCLAALAALPPAEIEAAFNEILTDFPVEAIPVAEYFESTFIGRHLGSNGAVHRPALFPPAMWSCHDRIQNASLF